jgi:tRNA(Ile)-lysidine synthase
LSGNVEAAARQARYDFFASQLQTGETLLLGHHSQDQLETVFMRLLQGRSLLPMRTRGRLGETDFLRPLLSLTRQQVLDYLNQQGITWVEDPSNRDEALTRNFLRHRIMPVLLQRWPSLDQTVERVTSWQQGQNALLHELLQEKGDQVSFSELPNAAPSQRAWLRIFLELRGHYGVTDRALDEFWRQSHQGATSRLDLAADSALMGWRNSLYYEADMSVYVPSIEVSPAPLKADEVTEFGGQHWLLERSDPQSADGFYRPGRLCLSARRKGLSMRWRGRKADIKEVFRQLDVPPWRRATVPLVVWQDEVVAVATLAINERFRDHPEAVADTGDYFRFVNVN